MTEVINRCERKIKASTYEANGESKYTTEVIAEKVTFLSSQKNKDKE